MFRYFVAYNFFKKLSYSHETQGSGNIFFELDSKINNLEIISSLEKKIIDEKGFDNVVIINFILLSED